MLYILIESNISDEKLVESSKLLIHTMNSKNGHESFNACYENGATNQLIKESIHMHNGQMWKVISVVLEEAPVIEKYDSLDQLFEAITVKTIMEQMFHLKDPKVNNWVPAFQCFAFGASIALGSTGHDL